MNQAQSQTLNKVLKSTLGTTTEAANKSSDNKGVSKRERTSER